MNLWRQKTRQLGTYHGIPANLPSAAFEVDSLSETAIWIKVAKVGISDGRSREDYFAEQRVRGTLAGHGADVG